MYHFAKMRTAAVALVLVSGSFAGMKAQTLKEALSGSTPVFWIGVDFSKAKAIDITDWTPSDIVDRQFDGINALVITEPKKFDLPGALHVSSVEHDLSYVNASNKKGKASELMSTASSDLTRFKEEDVKKIVSGYDFKGKTGIGFLLVCEAISKSAKEAAYWATYVDMKTKKILLTDRVTGKTAMSVGPRNFWAATIRFALENIEKHKFKEWKTRAGA